ncbi:MAG: hypothetical protein V4813_07130 [Gemmatimonadota bacterium]
MLKFSPRPPERRSPGAIVVSVVLHVAIAAVLLQAVVGSNRIAEWLIGPQGTESLEKVQMVAVTPPRGVNGGGAPVNATVKPSARTTAGVLVAPTSVPTAIPDAGGRGGSGGGTGTGIGTGSGAGAARGLVPGYDPRLYPGAPEEPRVARTPKERLDSVIAERFAEYSDSVTNAPRNANNVTEDGRGDLTITRGGKKYGWSQRGIVLGNITLPAPLLALLPLNRIGSNPTSIMRQENPWAMRSAIQNGAQVALNAETFNERVKRIRERRDRERREAREGQQPATPTPIQPQDRQ